MGVPAEVPQPAAPGDKFQVRVVGRMEGQETNNILHFESGTSSDIELDLIIALIECFVTNILPIASSQWTMEKVVWKRVSPTLGPEFETTGHGMGPGTGDATALPSFNSLVLSIRTAFGGPSGRGRMYLPGIPESATTNSSFNQANPYWTGVLNFVACLAMRFIRGDLPPANQPAMMVYSRKIGGSIFPYGNAGFHAVKSISPDTLIGTTRSRKVGRGS